MRRYRFLLSLSSIIFLVTFLLYRGLSSDNDESSNEESRRHSDPFSFRSPGSLFAPSATISLTEDNSTFFAARPAAFGPSLPGAGFSGQVWVGSGFGDDTLRRLGIAGGVEGELGCSDIAGWSDGDSQTGGQALRQPGPGGSGLNRRSDAGAKSTHATSSDDGHRVLNSEEESTDNSLHYPLPPTVLSKPTDVKPSLEHADIQSLQESAEIAGKIVLLSRGGCGFSEKVKWAQRRGATAVIVGDNIRGGPLIRMYAQDDTSNITIPSVFTSHTTAHLLSSLIPVGYNLFGPLGRSKSMDRIPGSGIASLQKPKNKGSKAAASTVRNGKEVIQLEDSNSATSGNTQLHGSWKERLATPRESTGNIGWISSRLSSMQGDSIGAIPGKELGKKAANRHSKLFTVDEIEANDGARSVEDDRIAGLDPTHEDFVIGVHDWRDADIAPSRPKSAGSAVSTASILTGATTEEDLHRRVGRITPSSGVYEDPRGTMERPVHHNAAHDVRSEVRDSRGWLSSLSWDAKGRGSLDGSERTSTSTKVPARDAARGPARNPTVEDADDGNFVAHDGLWVTLAPAAMDTSPFLNTLFVLVISPLITLAIVYAMLLIRSRIRRRRWRAPKSLVDRLPVRVYRTISRTNSSVSDSTQDQITSSTPLLSVPKPTENGPRPRSLIVSGLSASVGSSYRYGSVEHSAAEHEKVENGLAEWRRRYGGRQVECAVCLEEYVDGVSRVMSLPCGHEFHVDCITPWLTTRRRTCPICKGDVVRSMGNGSSPSRDEEVPESNTEEAIQQQAAETRNTSPSAALPLPSEQEYPFDLESGDQQTSTSSVEERSSWLTAIVGLGRRTTSLEDGNNGSTIPDRNR